MAKPSMEADWRFAPEQTGTAEDAERGKEADQAKALDGIEEAIRALIGDAEDDSGKPAASFPPRAPSAASARVQSNDRPLQRSGPRASDHDIARSAASSHSRLEPEIVLAPQVAMRQSGVFQQIVPLSLVTVFAVVSALIMVSTSQPGGVKSTLDRITGGGSQPKQARAISEQSSRLVVEDQQTFANEPLSLTVRVEHAAENESLLLDGLAPGTTLSAGTAKSPSSWQLPYDHLGGLYLYAPKDFIGVMNTVVNLLAPDKRLLDSRSMQLKWIAARQPMPALKTVSPETIAGDRLNAGQSSMPAPKTASPEAAAGDHLTFGQSPMPAVESIDAGEAAILIQKGRDLLSSGDISAARLVFRRLADTGSAVAALALASTYNPDYLAAHNFLGMGGDRATARALYQRAKELGSEDADRFLMQMQRKQ